MKTITLENIASKTKWLVGLALFSFFLTDLPTMAYAARGNAHYNAPNHGNFQNNQGNFRRDRDNNPPGRVGGPGTNWENPPGRAGGPGASPDRRGYGHKKNLKKRIDKNNDGQIDRREFRYAQHKRNNRDLDNNPPGRIGGPGTNWENIPGPQGGPGASPDYNQNRPNRRRQWVENHPQAAEYLDQNDDGRINRQEWRLGKQERRERFLENHPELQEQLDTNGDGQIDRQEFRQGRRERMLERIENNPELKQRIDRNGDGELDQQELKAARQAWKKRQARNGGNQQGPFNQDQVTDEEVVS